MNMEKKLKEGETPLFDLNDKNLIRFAHRTRNQLITDTVAPEMMRRLKVSIEKFNKNSSKQTKKMIYLTYWIIGLTVILGILALIQIYILIK